MPVEVTKIAGGKFVVDKYARAYQVEVQDGHLYVIGANPQGGMRNDAVFAPDKWVKAEVKD